MTKKVFDKIAAGLNEAIAVARGNAKPARLHEVNRLDAEARDAFMHAIDNPPAPGDKLKALMRRKPAWER